MAGVNENNFHIQVKACFVFFPPTSYSEIIGAWMLLGGVLSTYHVQKRFILLGFMENVYCSIVIAPIF